MKKKEGVKNKKEKEGNKGRGVGKKKLNKLR